MSKISKAKAEHEKANKPVVGTSVYPMVDATVCPLVIEKVISLDPNAPGGKRNRKHGAYCSIAILNDLETHSDPIILQGEMPQFLIDGDTLEDVKKRLFQEMTEVFKNAQMVLDGETTIEELQEKALGDQQVSAPSDSEAPTDPVKIEVPE